MLAYQLLSVHVLLYSQYNSLLVVGYVDPYLDDK